MKWRVGGVGVKFGETDGFPLKDQRWRKNFCVIIDLKAHRVNIIEKWYPETSITNKFFRAQNSWIADKKDKNIADLKKRHLPRTLWQLQRIRVLASVRSYHRPFSLTGGDQGMGGRWPTFFRTLWKSNGRRYHNQNIMLLTHWPLGNFNEILDK